MTKFTAYSKPIAIFLCALLCNIALWTDVRTDQSQWSNVPPVPSQNSIMFSFLGDKEFAYRSTGITLQNLGDTGGRTINFSEYNYDHLGGWLELGHSLNPSSNFLPFLAAYVFSANKDREKLEPIVNYLQKAGQVREEEKWRWLAQAAFIARFKMNNLDLALKIADELAQRDESDMPIWARSMSAYILNAQGEKEAAYKMLLTLLDTSGDKLHPNEVNATLDYICMRILDKNEAQANEICKNHLGL